MIRVATCRCGQLRASCTGDPVRVSVCHCLNCQKRSGSAFAVQARWPDDCVDLTGDFIEWSQAGDTGMVATFRFCGRCGGTISYFAEGMPGLTAIPVGAFSDPDFPPPIYSVYEGRKHSWVAVLGNGIEHYE